MNKKIIILGKGGGSIEGAVRYDEPQQLTDEQKRQAQENLGIDLSANLKREIVDSLPSEGEQNIIYMVAKQTSSTDNVYDEYMYINGQWELIGSTEVDLSGYYTKEEADDKFLTEHQPLKTINGESIIGEGDLEIKGFSGDYNDLINKPTILNHWFGTKEEYEAIVEKDENTIYHIEGGDSMWFGTQAQYDALTEKEKDVLYFIEGNGGDYYTKEETDTAIQGAKETLQGEINAKVDNDTYEAKISEIEGVLSEKTTMAEVEAKGYLTEHQPLKTINGEEIVGEGDIEIIGGNNWYGTEEEFKALGEYDETGNTLYHIEGQIDYKTDIKNLPLVPKKVSQLPNDAHYIQDVKKINGISMRGEGDIDIMKIIDKYHWWGTQEEYDAIEEKDANVQYHIEGDVPTETSSLIFELEDGTTKTIEVYIK